MKKTLIAAGIAAAVAAPAAFADVKISGVVEQQFKLVENAAMAEDSDNSLTFSASEDLGNGLTAFASSTLTTNDTAGTKDSKVGLKGSFGTVVIGRMEGLTKSKIHSKMTFLGAGDAGGDGAGNSSSRAPESALASVGSGQGGRADGGWAYVSPTMNGLHVGVAGFQDNASDIAVFYDNGPLSLAASRLEVKAADSSKKDEVTTSFAASYAMGDLKGTIVRTSVSDDEGTAGNDQDDMAYRLDYKMGNNTISVAYLDNEDSRTAGTSHAADLQDVTAVEFAHAFSKRTTAYVTYVTSDEGTGSTDVDTLAFGLQHKF
jgi:predicted porin